MPGRVIMAPNLHSYMMQTNNMTAEPVSRTYQYRKVMKPMLERKRRARINRCLDELKELMTSALQTVSTTYLNEHGTLPLPFSACEETQLTCTCLLFLSYTGG